VSSNPHNPRQSGKRPRKSPPSAREPQTPDSKSGFVVNLFEEQSVPLLKYLTTRFSNHDEAQEIAQEAWLRIFRLKSPQQLTNPRAFLFQTASNLAVDRLRRSKLEQRHLEKEAQVDVSLRSVVDVQETVRLERELATVQRALGELPVRCRQAFVMHRTHGYPYPRIAEELGVSTSSVEKYIIQALKHLRNKLT
jgi:RNA polymerase sigma-70 factor (ECF subfamily)|tara:strand:- start:180 stop:761 length:582 start_codon:yes stop_codon:yes gene_type:complete